VELILTVLVYVVGWIVGAVLWIWGKVYMGFWSLVEASHLPTWAVVVGVLIFYAGIAVWIFLL
jgi:hypothetical protein